MFRAFFLFNYLVSYGSDSLFNQDLVVSFNKLRIVQDICPLAEDNFVLQPSIINTVFACQSKQGVKTLTFFLTTSSKNQVVVLVASLFKRDVHSGRTINFETLTS